MTTIVSIVGARPQLIKLAEFCRVVAKDKTIVHKILHTGQHYDQAMNQDHIDDLDIPQPDRNLGINQGTNIENTALMMMGIERAFIEWKPDLVVVYGDTDSTLAGAMTALKMHIKLAHMEAGCRSGDIQMQEEVNRMTVDSLADLLLFSSRCNANSFKLAPHQTGIFVGDLMLDSLLRVNDQVKWKENDQITVAGNKYGKRDYNLLTIHRAENTDNKMILQGILSAIHQAIDKPTFLIMHPRLSRQIDKFGITIPPSLTVITPQRYQDNLKLIAGANKVITDSGGMQKEAFWLKTPCVTLRDSTEWPETLNNDRNILTGADRERIKLAIKLKQNMAPPKDPGVLFGSGLGAKTALNAIKSFLNNNLGIV